MKRVVSMDEEEGGQYGMKKRVGQYGMKKRVVSME